MSEYLNKEQFINYSKNKIKNLGDVTYKNPIFENELVTSKILLKQDIREFDSLFVVMPEDPCDDVLIAVDKYGEVKINTPMFNAPLLALRGEFDLIDKEFYNEILEFWQKANYDELSEESTEVEDEDEL